MAPSGRKILAAIAVATAAAAATPAAHALTLDAVTTGPLFRAAKAAGFNDITFDVAELGSVTINLGYSADSSPTVLGNTINELPFGGYNPINHRFKRQPGQAFGGAILAASGRAAYGAGHTYEALLSSAQGTTPDGYTPLVPSGKVNAVTGVPCISGFGCLQGVNVTNIVLLQVNNPGTPNGGLYTRFAPILAIFGRELINPTGTSSTSTGLMVNGATMGLGWGYHALSDFPATLNPFSLVNTFLATVLPTNLLGGATLKGTSPQTLGANLTALLSYDIPSTAYSTVVPGDLPLLEPLRLPSRLINQVFAAVGIPLNLGTPLADALEPALSILVNTGYTDVSTPAEGGTYNRTYNQSGQFVPYLSKAPLTPAEWVQVPGDLVRALVVGFQDSFPILRFGRTAPVLTVAGKHLAVRYPPAAVSAPLTAPAVTRPALRHRSVAAASSITVQKAARTGAARSAR